MQKALQITFSDSCPDLYKKTGFVFPLRKGIPALHHFSKTSRPGSFFPHRYQFLFFYFGLKGNFIKRYLDHYLSDSLPYECVFQYKAPFSLASISTEKSMCAAGISRFLDKGFTQNGFFIFHFFYNVNSTSIFFSAYSTICMQNILTGRNCMFFCWKTIFIPQGNRNFQLFALFSRIYFPAESGYTAGSSVSSLDRKLLFQGQPSGCHKRSIWLKIFRKPDYQFVRCWMRYCFIRKIILIIFQAPVLDFHC